MRKKVVIITTLATVIAFGGTGAYAYTSHVQAKEFEQKVDQTLSSMYSDPTAVTKDEIQTAKQDIVEVKNREKKEAFSKKLDDISMMVGIYANVQALLDNDAIKDSVTMEQIESVSNDLEKIKTMNKMFYNEMKTVVENVSTQYADIEKATNAIVKLEKEPDEKEYQMAQGLVGKIKNEKVNKELNDRLSAVHEEIQKAKALAEAKRLEEEKRMVEEKRQAEQASRQVTQNSTTAKSTEKNSTGSKATQKPSTSESKKSASNPKPKPEAQDPFAQDRNWDAIGKSFEEAEWVLVGEGKIKGTDNTWRSYRSKEEIPVDSIK